MTERTAAKTTVGVGVYVRPVDATDDPEHTHKLEGTVWAVETIADPKTGELVEWAHVARLWHGDLVFNMLPVERVGSCEPADPATIDSLIRIAAKLLANQGRRSDHRVFAVLHACAFMLALPQVVKDTPSVYGDVPEPTVEQVTQPGVTVDHDAQVARLVDRLNALDHVHGNEARRSAQTLKLPVLEADAELTLSDIVAYDALLSRWERLAGRRTAAAS